MRLSCPCCGTRDLREFTFCGAAVLCDRPAPDAGEAAWEAYLHLRDNPAGASGEIWYHDPCGAFCRIERDTVSHAVGGSVPLAGTRL